MADHSPAPNEPNSGMDYREHDTTYRMFVGLLKWGTIATIVVLLLMLAFCTPS
jgi:hypothetical protein